MTQKVQRQHAFTISLILNRIIVRSLTKPLPSSPLTVSERTVSQRLVSLGGVESEDERTREKNQFGLLLLKHRSFKLIRSRTSLTSISRDPFDLQS